jgi:MFS family permease
MLGLSALIFFISDVHGGVGPFLAIYLQSVLHWNAGKIGLALAMIGIVAILCQAPAGFFIDFVKAKRFLMGLSCLMIIVGCFFILIFKNLIPILFAQSLMGIASTIAPPGITAITIGMVGRKLFPKRASINEIYNHAGNLLTAGMMGITAQLWGHNWIIYTVITFCMASILSLFLIRPSEIDYNVARELPEPNPSGKHIIEPLNILTFLKMKSLIIFLIAVVLFHFSNAAQLPLVGELLAQKNPHIDALFMAASIILAQLVMAGVAYVLSLIINYVGRKPIFVIAFLVLPIRAILYTLTPNPILLLTIQLLDGIGAGIFGVISVVTISDLAKGTGRFNFGQGLVALCVSIGTSLSNVTAGFITKNMGFNGGFIFLAIIAILGLMFYTLLMPETRNNNKKHNEARPQC